MSHINQSTSQHGDLPATVRCHRDGLLQGLRRWLRGLREVTFSRHRSMDTPLDISRFSFQGNDVAGDIRAKYPEAGDLLQIFAGMKDVMVHKWHHYIPLYERYFGRFRGTGFRFLEIGVSQGGSLQMWRDYFGADAVIYGVDIDPDCARFNGQSGQVRIGSQADPAFLNAVVDEMGGLDVVLDDGSHQMRHLRQSLSVLFPRLEPGGCYLIEDLHTAYWEEFDGGYREPANFFHTVGEIIEDMHRWYHPYDLTWPGIGDAVSGVHVHDSITVLEKGPIYPPVHSQVGPIDPSSTGSDEERPGQPSGPWPQDRREEVHSG